MEAVEDKSGIPRYIWVSGSRGLLVSLTMHLIFHSLSYGQCSKKPEIRNIINITCIYHPITDCVLVYLGTVKILKQLAYVVRRNWWYWRVMDSCMGKMK